MRKCLVLLGVIAAGVAVESLAVSASQKGRSQELWDDYRTSSTPMLMDWSAAGYRFGAPLPSAPVTHDVTAYGAVADDGLDDGTAVQAAIDAAESAGGGVVFFPPGQFDFQVAENRGHALTISGANVVIRGSGSGAGGTLLKQWSLYPGSKLDRFYLIHVDNGYADSDKSVKLAEDAPRLARSIKLNSSAGLAVGDVVVLQMIAGKLPEGGRDPALNHMMVSPLGATNAAGEYLYKEPQWKNFNRFEGFRLMVQVAGLEDGGKTVRLAQPLPQALQTAFGARMKRVAGGLFSGVGVEHLAIVGCFDDSSYRHHGNWEMDYGWNGIGFFGVAHGWVRDVSFSGMTEDVICRNVMNCTFENLTSEGDGHYGNHIATGYYCLADGYRLKGMRTHIISMSNLASANVFRHIQNLSGRSGRIDFHGGGPANNNLVENSVNLRIGGGGAHQNLPHSGRDNTFWNIVAGPKDKVEDLFTNGEYMYSTYKGRFKRGDLHQLYPGSVVVGIQNGEHPITVDGGTAYRNDEWLYVDSVGSEVQPLSIYAAEREFQR